MAIATACPHCGRAGAYRARLNTAFSDDSRNYAYLCADCHEESHEHYAEMWREYHSGCM